MFPTYLTFKALVDLW